MCSLFLFLGEKQEIFKKRLSSQGNWQRHWDGGLFKKSKRRGDTNLKTYKSAVGLGRNVICVGQGVRKEE